MSGEEEEYVEEYAEEAEEEYVEEAPEEEYVEEAEEEYVEEAPEEEYADEYMEEGYGNAGNAGYGNGNKHGGRPYEENDAGYTEDIGGYNNGEVTEVSEQGYFERVGNSFAGICFGVILFFGAFPLLWWNEGRAVDMYKAINEGRNSIVPINAASIDSTNEGALVYLTGIAKANGNITDPDFGVDAREGTIMLNRNVELYQWEEKKETEKRKSTGGKETTVTKYVYGKTWSTSLIDTSTFKNTKYVNPTSMPYLAEPFTTDVTIGSFFLPTDLVSSMTTYEALDVTFTTDMLPSTNSLVQSLTERADNNGFYFSVTKNATASSGVKVGDTRVTYMASGGGQISIIAKQKGDTFEPFKASSGASLYRLSKGSVSSDEMFDNAAAENKLIAWLLRFLGMFIMSAGIGLILQPLSVAVDIIPCLGSCVGGAISCVATLIGVVLSLLVIAIAWVAQRPVFLGIAGAGVLLVGGLVVYRMMNKNERNSNNTKEID